MKEKQKCNQNILFKKEKNELCHLIWIPHKTATIKIFSCFKEYIVNYTEWLIPDVSG